MSFVDKSKLYNDLYSAYSKAHSQKTKQSVQDSVNIIWNNNKKKSDLINIIQSEIKNLHQIASKRRVTIASFWNKANEVRPTATSTSTNEANKSINVDDPISAASSAIDKENSVPPVVPIESTSDEGTKREANKHSTPAQDKLKIEALVLSADIGALEKRKNIGWLDDNQTKEFQAKKKRLNECHALIKKKEIEMIRQRELRRQRKFTLAKAFDESPTLRQSLKFRDTVGRPRIEYDQPLLLSAIIDLALQGSAAHERRRDDSIRSVKTLDDLVQKLYEDYGISLSRSATYLRLLPKRSNSIHGKRHVITVPVKLIKSSNDMHRQHSDTKFAMATINHINELASMLGPNEVTYISQDDKAKIPIGLPAASKQGPLLMHMQYRVKLPDHDFVLARGHKLTPSVYAFCEIKPNGGGDRSAVTYSGPTFISIRSAKHSSSTALSHGRDIQNIYASSDFDKYTKTKGLDPKPVFIAIVDGGPDENPRYENVIRMHVHHFLRYDLDAVIVACNAPGRSAFNRVERRMAPLSRSVVGIILPHDHYGTHLDSRGRTVDVDLEKVNFSYAGKALAEVWSDTIIDGHVTVAEYVDPESSNLDQSSILTKDVNWYDRHVFQSQYLLQILKCSDPTCCKPRRSSLFKFVPPNGLPSPIPIQQTDAGLRLANIADIQNFALLFPTLALTNEEKKGMIVENKRVTSDILYDQYCSSVQSKISDRTCVCGRYFSSVASMKSHLKSKLTCKIKKQPKQVKVVKLLGKRNNERLALVQYDNEEDVEWVYDMDLDTMDDFTEPDASENAVYDIQSVLEPIWEDAI